MLQVGSDVIPALRPELTASPQAIDLYADRLLGYALAMVASEAERRAQPPDISSQISPQISDAAKAQP
jgi:hypothetical protein